MIFGGVDSTELGAHGHLRLVRNLTQILHRDAMEQYRSAPRDEREQYAEQASKLRELMDNHDMARMVMGMAGGRGWR